LKIRTVYFLPLFEHRRPQPTVPAGHELRHRQVRIIRDYGMQDRREAPQFYPPVEGGRCPMTKNSKATISYHLNELKNGSVTHYNEVIRSKQ
jgi:hypothetical protein